MQHAQFDAEKLVEHLASELSRYLNEKGIENPAMVGIHTGGVWVAERLHQALGLERPLGRLDITFYRDDFSQKGLHPVVKPSSLPFEVDDQHILLVDDVLHTGRTIRAAMNELFDYGRPASIHLIVLVERSGRELPIEANLFGHNLTLAPGQHIKLSGPEPLALELLED
ncbi:MAG TPA: bifunctional pyr operon transcriptional regulator/uracil phosphoribosyltransferase PyrR [Gammaproteobacteria bacterium]|nr:bifunctional pyr operon transcriptional regulator/uracil phosphoribosyltransferase PyrR [Gammaproteobacteria bacterium]